MNNGLKYFLAVAEEKNISRAAQKLFVSQQALSEQMKRLEEQYQTTLFIRKPAFALTASGELMLRAAREVENIEKNLRREINDINNIFTGTIHFGLNVELFERPFAHAMAEFNTVYPNVSVVASGNNTEKQIKLLQNGSLDAFLGRDVPVHSEFEYTPLIKERILLAATDELLMKHIGKIPEKSISIHELRLLPLIIHPSPSTIRTLSDGLFSSYGYLPHYVLTVLGYSQHLNLAAEGIGACFTPELIAKQHGYPAGLGGNVRCLPVDELSRSSQLDLVTNKNSFMPSYLKFFIELMIKYCTQMD